MQTEINTQAAEKPTRRGDGAVEIVDLFWTIQGEGPFAGQPAVFVRTAGCNLACPSCDTVYTENRRYVTPLQLVGLVDDLFPPASAEWRERLVVLTGGEPFRQHVAPAVRELLTCGFKVQVETNGTLFPEDFPFMGDVHLVVSPKVGRVHEELRPYVKHLKYVVTAGRQHERTRLPLTVLGNTAHVDLPWPGFRGTVWVQPADEQNDEVNKANMEAAVDACLTRGYRFSLQTHKIMGVA